VCRHLLDFRWSPGQIAATLRRMHPDDPSARVSPETIYAMIYAQPPAEEELELLLPPDPLRPEYSNEGPCFGLLPEPLPDPPDPPPEPPPPEVPLPVPPPPAR
jgi:hypothetical protein